MDGSLRVQRSDRYPSVGRVNGQGERKPSKRFDPEALADEEPEERQEEANEDHHSTPVGHKPDDESGSRLDLTA